MDIYNVIWETEEHQTTNKWWNSNSCNPTDQSTGTSYFQDLFLMRQKFIKIRIKEEIRKKKYKVTATEEFNIIGNPLQTPEKALKAKHHKDDKKMCLLTINASRE